MLSFADAFFTSIQASTVCSTVCVLSIEFSILIDWGFFYWFGRKRETFDCRAKVSLHTKIRKRRRYNFTIFARTRGLSKKSIHYMIWTVATSIHTQQSNNESFQ